MLTIGLTGNMGSGKSTAAAYLAQLGAAVIDADAVAHQLLAKGGRAYQPLLDAFGERFAPGGGEIDRRALARHIFSDPSGALALQLNELTHPLIRDEIRRRLAALAEQGYGVAVVEAAMMFEGRMAELLDRIWVIVSPVELQLERIRQRDSLPEEDILARLNRQLPPEELMRLADTVIINDGPLADLQRRLAEQYQQLLEERA